MNRHAQVSPDIEPSGDAEIPLEIPMMLMLLVRPVLPLQNGIFQGQEALVTT